jgi:hypothetical protein
VGDAVAFAAKVGAFALGKDPVARRRAATGRGDRGDHATEPRRRELFPSDGPAAETASGPRRERRNPKNAKRRVKKKPTARVRVFELAVEGLAVAGSAYGGVVAAKLVNREFRKRVSARVSRGVASPSTRSTPSVSSIDPPPVARVSSPEAPRARGTSRETPEPSRDAENPKRLGLVDIDSISETSVGAWEEASFVLPPEYVVPVDAT